MRKFSLALLALAFGFSLAFAAQDKTIDVPQVDGSGDPSGFVGWVPNEFIVQLTREATVSRLSNLQNRTSAAAAVTGLAELAPLADAFEVDKFEKEFVDAQPQPIVSVKPDLSGYFIVRFNRGTLEEAMAAFAKNPLVDHVEPIGIHKVDFTPNDTYANPGQAFGYQWALEQGSDEDIDAFTAWDIQKGATNVVLAGMDTGVRYFHRDLGGDAWGTGPFGTGGTTTGNIWINTFEKNGTAGVDDDGNGFVDDVVGYDFVTGVAGCASGEDCSTIDNDPRDFNGHGTHTAGTMAAITHNARSVAGVAGGDAGGLTTGIGNGSKIMCLRIGWSDPAGNGFVNMAFAAQALNYAAAVNNSPGQTAKVVAANASWGSSNSGGILAAYQNAIAAGILFVKAAGNSNNSTADFLNARGGDSTMSVAATDSFDVKASFSSFGSWVDVSAPGVDIISTYHVSSDPANDYVAKSSGTSMSAPHTAGLAGLLKSQDGSLTRSQISSLIKNNTDNINAQNPGFVGLLGTGRINAQKSLAAIAPSCNVVANFSGAPTSGCAPLAVNFTDLSTGPVTSWSWNFGDGNTSTAQNPSNTYAAAGTYTVTLTVTSATCSDGETKTGYVTVGTTPTANFIGSPTSGCAPLTASFTDQSTGGPTSWSWDFGDGNTSTAQNPSHVYASAGSYTVSLTVSSAGCSDGEIKTNYITVNAAPTAAFVGAPTSGCALLTVNFTDQSTGGPTSWSWDFGDGNTSTAQSPSHIYAAAGTYTVSLTVTAAGCSDGETKTNYITVTSAPTAQFVGSPTSGQAPLTVNFTDQSTGGPTSWAWNFGDAGTSTAQNPSHVYAAAGTYTVTLTASNTCGSDPETKVSYITVTAPPTQQCDDFADGNISNWGNSLGTWTATGGFMKGNSNTLNARRTSPFGSFAAATIDGDVRMNSGRNQRKARVIWAYVDGNNYRFVEGDDETNRWRIYERTGGSNILRLNVNQTINTAQWYHVTVTVAANGSATLAVNGVTLGSYAFGSSVSGLVGCGFNRSNSDFDNFCVGTGGGALASENKEPGLEVMERVSPMPKAFTLGQNYPNPFNPMTNISFTLPEAVKAELVVFNMLGQRVRTLANEVRSAGTHMAVFDGRDDRGSQLPSGIYFYRMRVGKEVVTKQMMFIK